jgi:hypothetical protein
VDELIVILDLLFYKCFTLCRKSYVFWGLLFGDMCLFSVFCGKEHFENAPPAPQ